MLSGSFAKKEVFSIILRENRVQAFQNEEKCGAWFGFLRNFQREEGTYLRCSLWRETGWEGTAGLKPEDRVGGKKAIF
jgi:hypothetical protein